ncbi:MAG: class I poly(R)-hydroxyalkanoic acid synthase [Pseudomonadota bacterium]
MTDQNKIGPFGHSTLPAAFQGFEAANWQEMTANLFQATQQAQMLIMDQFGKAMTAPDTDRMDPFGAMDSQKAIGKALAANPSQIGHAMMTLSQGWMNLFQSMATGTAAPKDRRFADPEWSANPMFDFMRRAWTLNAEWLESLVDSVADDMDTETALKAKFFTRQFIDMMSPTNMIATNPAALRAMLETNGQSLVHGFEQMRQDLKRGNGRLQISQSDEGAFTIGENVATAEGQVIYRNKLIEIIHYKPTKKKVYARPMLIFPPWINKFYILDLQPENSMIRWLLSQGVDTFLVSWRSADAETKHYSWDDYVEHGALAAISAVTAETGAKDVNAIGYCIGGTMLTTALGHMAKTGDERVNSATYFASQSDFELAGDLKVFTTDEAVSYLDEILDAHGDMMPGGLMGETFNWLRPSDLVWRYVVDNYMLGKEPKPFDLLYWNADQTNIPGPTHRTYVNTLYNQNALAEGKFKVFGEPVSMSDIETPIYVQASKSDHICPWHSIYRAAREYGGDVTFTMAGSGHIAGVINPPSSGKYQHWVNPDLPEQPDDWFAHAEERPGSWWPSWWTWLEPRFGKKKDAVDPQDHGLGAAPGQYVKMRLSDIAAGKKPAGPYSDGTWPHGVTPKPIKVTPPQQVKSKPKKKKKSAKANAKTKSASKAGPKTRKSKTASTRRTGKANGSAAEV